RHTYSPIAIHYKWRGAVPRADYSQASGLPARTTRPTQLSLPARTTAGQRPANSRHGAQPRAIG
ncbi:hypothetical protein, partial [Hymenobacter profundi]